MTDLNKKNLKNFGKVLAVALPGFIALIAFMGILNGVVVNKLDSFYGWVGGINFVIEIFLLYRLYKSLFKKEDKEVKPNAPVVNHPVVVDPIEEPIVYGDDPVDDEYDIYNY